MKPSLPTRPSAHPRFRTVSFDLYDTVLVRPVLRPIDIFRLVEKELAEPGWAAARVGAERAARQKAPCGEACLEEIQAAQPLRRYAHRAEEARHRELAWEERTLVSPHAARTIAEARASGAEILFVSDMYLPRSTIERVLGDQLQAGDTLYLSHEQRQGKGTGLWERLVNRHAKPWRHYGDNPTADGSRARAVGIDTVISPACHPNLRERLLDHENPHNPLVAGLARLARLSAPDGADASWDDGANVVGPVFVEFTRWVMEQATQQGAEAVYFLARDGELPAKIAETMRPSHPHWPPAYYLLGSRHAFYNAAFNLRDPQHREWMIYASPSSVRGLLANLKTKPEDIEGGLVTIGYGPERWDEILSASACRAVLSSLADGAWVDSWMAERRRTETAPALAYFSQMNVFAYQRVVLVDIGWSGTTLESFRAIVACAAAPRPEVRGLFFGLHRNAGPDRLSYAFGPRALPYWAAAYPAVLEMMVPGSHGQVTGYMLDSAQITQPTCAPAMTADPQVIEALHGGALVFARFAHRAALETVAHRKTLQHVIECPTPAEVERWSRLRFGSLQTADACSAISLVPRVGALTALAVLIAPRRNLHLWPWPNAMVVAALPRCPRIFLRGLSRKYAAMRLGWNVLRTTWRFLKRAARPN